MKWFELDEAERIKQVYSQYTIKDFWDFWAGEDNVFMEVRIKDWEIIKQVGTRYNIPYSSSGVYVKNEKELKNVIAIVRDKATIWFGINGRKKNWNRRGWKSFEGKDTNVDSINYIFIDIDRVKKEGIANKKDLEHCNILSELILERLGKQKWNNNYIKICSGNGVQLLIGLDVPVKLPNVEFDNKTKIYIPNSEFDKIKHIIKNGIGKQIVKFSNKHKEELGVEVDISGMLIGKVGALPCTKNFKYDSFTWRGIVDLKNEINTGLSDYVLTFEDDEEQFTVNNIFSTKKLTKNNILRPGKLKDNKLVKFMLENDFPKGYINNTLWFQLKCLLRDSNFDLQSKEFILFHRKIQQKHKRDFSINLPDKKYIFNENTVNNYCIQCGLPLVYKLFSSKTKKLDMKLEILEWKHIENEKEHIKLDDDTSIIEDMESFKKQLIEGDHNNIFKVPKFTNGCIKKYGGKKTKYYFDILFYKYFSYE